MTEKDYNPERRNKKITVNAKLNDNQKIPEQKKEPPKEAKKEKIAEADASEDNAKVNEGKDKETKSSEPIGRGKVSGDKPVEEKPAEEKKKPHQKKPFVKKTEAVVSGFSLPISSKVSFDICRFIKYKKIPDAVADLEKVLAKKKAVPMKGEIPHRKGKIMAGRFPKNASEHFIKMLKELSANANVNGLENPVVVEAFANFASRPYGRFGRVKKKRTNIKIIAREKVSKNKNTEEKK